jgi:hypothetical protein
MKFQELRFIRENIKKRLNIRNISQFRNLFSVLLLVSVVNSLVLDVFLLAKPMSAYGGISAKGEINVYDSDGKTPLTSFDLPRFTGGIVGTFTKYFFINNTGQQPVGVSWNMTVSSIHWELRALSPNVYDHYEGSILKYSFGITQDAASIDYWYPNQETIVLKTNEGVKLRFELNYTGEPNTAETFTMTAAFYAGQPILGDINSDLTVNLADLILLQQAFGAISTSPNWNPNADLNNDGKIDASDLYILSRNYGKTA